MHQTLDHVGIAAEQPEAVAALYEKLLGGRPYKQETVEHEGVRTHFIQAGATKLELLEALGPDSPVQRFLDKRGEGLHHLAFEVADVQAEMERLQKLGFQPLSDAPRPGADGKLIFFLHPKDTHGVLVEFCQSVTARLAPQSVPFRDGHLAVYRQDSTEGQPLVLLHGALGSTVRETSGLLRALEPYRRLFALDFPGHGASDGFADVAFSTQLFAESVLATLDFFEIEQADVFGFSMGGYVALYLARHHPKRVRRLALHATSIFWNGALVAAMTERIGEPHERMRRFVETLPEGPLREADLTQIRCPTLVSAVDRDDLFDLADTLRLHRTLPNARLALFPGDRHALFALDATLYAATLRETWRDR